MEPLEIAEKVKNNFPGDVVDMTQFRDQFFVSIKPEKVLDICRFLHDDPEINMDYLADLCGVDYPDRKQRFEVIYNLFSIKNKHRLILKALLPEDELSVDSVVSIWSGANWHERETCDMYGIVFNGHPDLRRILMPEDWEGYPQRKDYPLKGPDREYKAFHELKDLHSHDNEWSIQQTAEDK